jgi:hypothetical protein
MSYTHQVAEHTRSRDMKPRLTDKELTKHVSGALYVTGCRGIDEMPPSLVIVQRIYRFTL